MSIKLQGLDKLADYDNILITDDRGHIIFFDVADLNVLKELGSWPEDIIGRHITSFYDDLTDENSTVMQVLRTSDALCNIEQKMTTRSGRKIISISSTFPIINDSEMLGTIEFSKRYFQKENIQALTKLQKHKIYRKNNTVYTINDLISKNLVMEKIKSQIKKLALNNSTALIYGETGTGKEIVAQAIHNASDRYMEPFISLNCSAIPETLMESTLFGTVKGSFTGAEDRPGVFEQANNGTIFLDEINSLPIHLQVKLLKAVEEKQIRRIGGTENIFVDFRLISAMNEDPEQLVKERRLREDLYYRLNVVQISLPPLRERREDIPILLDHFITMFNENMYFKVTDIDPDALKCLQAYDWPGNVRELKNTIETVYNTINSSTVTIEDLPERITRNKKSVFHPIYDTGLQNALEQYEQELIEEALAKSDGNAAEAAKNLKISRQALQYKRKKYNLM